MSTRNKCFLLYVKLRLEKQIILYKSLHCVMRFLSFVLCGVVEGGGGVQTLVLFAWFGFEENRKHTDHWKKIMTEILYRFSTDPYRQ